jgi:hypothetical protein
VFCDKTIVPEGLTSPQLSFNFTIRENERGDCSDEKSNFKPTVVLFDRLAALFSTWSHAYHSDKVWKFTLDW